MKRSCITTADGSSSVFDPFVGESYHSKHGAIQESQHVFINHGLSLFRDQEISILEYGFGTGLNALLTWLSTTDFRLKVIYTTLEKHPLQELELSPINYPEQVEHPQARYCFDAIHKCPWEQKVLLDDTFSIQKNKKDFIAVEYHKSFDLVYYDAFSPRVQPELWTESAFLNIINSLKKNGIMVTYCAKGNIRRMMQHIGFKVERLPGPPGKREMLRAYKL